MESKTNSNKKEKTETKKTINKKNKTEKIELPKKKETSKNNNIPKKTIKLKKSIKYIIIGISILLIVIALIIILINSSQDKNTDISSDKNNKNENISDHKEQEEKLTVYDMDSKSRPIAVMISNDYTAKKRQFGIQKAYLVYEITVEGGITRLMALFKDTIAEKVGPVRSSRHYYLDYTLENDAIYTHYGWSPQAQSDISTLDIDNLNGLYNPSNMFWRDENYSSPNNAYTSTDNIIKAAKNNSYELTSDNFQLLKYEKEVDLTKDETYKEANSLKINYSGAYVKYIYDKENKYYLRYNDDEKHIDLETKEQVNVKNIIVLKMDTETIANDSSGRQNLYNIGSGDGYYISNGQSIEITWSKKSRESKTIYKKKNGEELIVNDGNTYIQIQPISKKITIE